MIPSKIDFNLDFRAVMIDFSEFLKYIKLLKKEREEEIERRSKNSLKEECEWEFLKDRKKI